MTHSTECKLHEIPEGLVMPAAYCMADFGTVCNRIGARPTIGYITYSKKLKKPRKRYRYVGLRLSNGRFAELLKEDEEKYFEISLQRKGCGYFLSEVEEVRNFIAVEKSHILRLDNAMKWIQPSNAEPVDLPIMTMEIATSEPWQHILNDS